MAKFYRVTKVNVLGIDMITVSDLPSGDFIVDFNGSSVEGINAFRNFVKSIDNDILLKIYDTDILLLFGILYEKSD